jgi:OOP family OmpA-OmpF porin
MEIGDGGDGSPQSDFDGSAFMMQGPQRWWAGLPVLVMIWGVANLVQTGPVERDIEARAVGAQAAAGVALDGKPWAGVAVSGRDVTITGRGPSEENLGLAASSAGDVRGVRLVRQTAALIPEARPFRWRAEIRDGKLELGGSLPPDGTRGRLAARAESLGLTFSDRAESARGAPAGFGALASELVTSMAGLSDASAGIEDTAVTIEGAARSPADYARITAALAALPSGYSLASAKITPPLVSPYAWTVSRDPAGLSLSGHVPNDALRKALHTRASGMGAARDTTTLALGEGEGFESASASALAIVESLKSGRVELQDRRISVIGEAATPAARKAVFAALETRPKGWTLGLVEIPIVKVDPFVFEARVRDGGAVLDGFVPDEATRRRVVDLASEKLLGGSVNDRLDVAEGAPPGFDRALGAAIEILSRLSSGAVSLSGSTISLGGEALHRAAADELNEQLVTLLPKGWSGSGSVGVAPPAPPVDAGECQALMNELLGRGRILFETARADLRRDSVALLDRLSYATRRCPDVRVEIAGHTDADGAADYNFDLSRKRAWSVVDYLVKAGVDPSRLTAEGYGPSNPIAPNDSDENKAKNRRIEFVVKR